MTDTPADIGRYYDRRAQEYEVVYNREDPVRRHELGLIANHIRSLFTGKQVLEVACGTGYWTQVLASSAREITAFDQSPEMIQCARQKMYDCPVRFQQCDAYSMEQIPTGFEGGLANFWFSHVPKEKIDFFLNAFHARLNPGAPVFMADNTLLPGLGGDLVSPPDDDNTYKQRTLADGSEHLILKNYFCEKDLRAIFQPYADQLEITFAECFWWISYVLK